MRAGAPANRSCVAQLNARGLDTILKKMGEAAVGTAISGTSGDMQAAVCGAADLWFHTLAMLSHPGLGPHDVLLELARRSGVSGLAQKAARQGITNSDGG
ncbi:MAG: phosphoribosyl-ATP diphosphatase [Chromatiales bacterium]|nr:phosphoribosyl-ATP diphosphatase [Chromatiales bacterium]